MDHKRVAMLYLVGTGLAFLVGGVFAMLIRIHLWEPEGTLFNPDFYNRMFTLHGVFMVFFFIIPAIPGALGNFCLPPMPRGAARSR